MSAQLQEQQRQQQSLATQANDLVATIATEPATPDATTTGTPAAHDTGAGRTQASRPSQFPEIKNRASESDSPYVRLHADTPVAWQLLDDAALDRAGAENKPIFMHIGFLSDHRESARFYYIHLSLSLF